MRLSCSQVLTKSKVVNLTVMSFATRVKAKNLKFKNLKYEGMYNQLPSKRFKPKTAYRETL